MGGWVDPAAKSRVAMPALYSSAHSHRQISLKTELVSLTTKSLAKFHSSDDSNVSNPTWEHIFKFWMERGEKYILPIPDEPPIKKTKNVIPEEPKAVGGDEEDSSSASISSLEVEDTAEPAANDDDELDELYPQSLAKLEWQISTGKKGCVHIVNHDLSLACGRTLKCPETGVGLSQAYSSGRPMSPRCFNAMSKAAKRWWKDIEAA